MRYSLVSFAIICSIGIIPSLHAQVTPAPFGGRGDIAAQDVYSPPEVYTLQATIESQEGNTIKGTVFFWNKSKDIIPDLRYSIDLLGALPVSKNNDPFIEDNAPVYETVIKEEPFMLFPDEEREFQYTYTAPTHLPSGGYRLQFTVSTSRGRTMGWYDLPVTFTSEEPSTFVSIQPIGISISQYGNQQFPAESGPNVNPNERFSLLALVSSPENVHVMPSVSMHEFSVFRPTIRTTNLSVIEASVKQTRFKADLIAPKTAGVYIAVLSLRDLKTKELASNTILYRFVVRGEDADITHVRIRQYPSGTDTAMNMKIDYVGAGDAETKNSASFTATLLDDTGMVGEFIQRDVPLTDLVGSGIATISLQRPLGANPRLTMGFVDSKGTSLMQHSFSLTPSDHQLQGMLAGKRLRILLLYGSIMCVLTGIVVLGFLKIRPKKRSLFASAKHR